MAERYAGSDTRFVVDSRRSATRLDDAGAAASERSSAGGVPYLIDPIIEPIGFGFMASLERYAEVHRRWPTAPQS